ncbi:MAG: tetratricopeptide repeat protein [Candidatus Firestonebacteria bacterium]
MNCDKGKIIEYLDNELEPLEMQEIKGHLETCQACQENLENVNKINDFMSVWQEKQDFGKDFDYNILNKGNSLLEKRGKISIFQPIWRLAITVTCLLLIIIVYKNAIFDNSIQELYNVVEFDIKNNIELKDFKKIYIPNKVIKEIVSDKLAIKDVLNFDFISNIPDNIIFQEQKIDIYGLLRSTMYNKRAQRFWLLNFFDDSVRTIEGNLKIDFSVANVDTSISDLFKKACLDFENKSYNNALEKLKTVISDIKSPVEVSSALFKSGYIYETLQRYDEAISFYKRVKKEFPDTIQSVLSDEMIKLANERKVISAKIDKIKNKITPETYYELGNMYLFLLDYNSAINAYSHAISQRARFNSGWCHKIKGNNEEALQMFNSMSSDEDLKMVSYNIMSLIYIKQGERVKADELFKEDEYPIVYKNLIKKYFKSIEKK